jgi:translocation and assembly module TamB
VRWRKTIRWTLPIFATLFVCATVGGYIYLKSNAFRRYALQKIEEQAAESTGARAQIGSLDLTLSPLRVRFENVVLRGTEPAGDPPLLRVDELTVGLKIRSLLHREINLSELLVLHPVLYVRVDREGKNNIPQPPSSQSHTSVFDLAIGHFGLSGGEIFYNEKKTPVNANLFDLHTDIKFDSAATAYKGSIGYSNGQIAYAQYPPLPHNARAQFTVNPSTFSLESAVLTSASSILSLNASVSNFNNPVVAGNYDIRLHTQDFAALSPSAKPAGDVHLTGRIHYQNADNQSFLGCLAVTGLLESNGLSALSPGGKIDIRSLRARYELANGTLRANEIAANTLGGELTAEAEMRNLDTTPASHIRAAIHNISLRAIQQSTRQANLKQVAVAGILDGSLDAAWTGGSDNLRARSDLTVRGGAKNTRNNSATIPVDAVIHALYDGASGTLTVKQSNLQAASLTVSADGEVSKRSSLHLRAQANDLHQLALLASSFGSATNAPPPISGSATLDVTVQGAMQRPQVSGQLNAANLHVQGSDWTSARLSFTAASSQVVVSNGSLVSANQGRASFGAKVALRDWSYAADSPIRAELSMQRIAVADLQRLANVQYPITGDLSAHLSVNGSQMDPSGSGSAEIANAHAYGEPIETLALKFQAANGFVTSNLNVAISAGSATTTLTYTPKTRAYKFKLDAPSVVLQKVHRLQSKQTKGTVSVSANGEGTLDNPQLTAIIGITQLEVQQKQIGGLKANLQVANKRANLSLDSQISQASVHARAQVDLTGDYQTDAVIDSGEIPFDALLASFSASMPEGFQGHTELHATLKGPLKDKTRIEAHVTIPTLTVSYQQLQIGAASPIRADYADSIFTLQPAEIRGTDTSLRLQGSIPFAGSSPPTLTAQGSINMQILRLFDSELQSSGTISLDVHATGSPKSPSVQGQVRIQDVALATAASPLGVEKLNGTLNVADERVQISGMTAQVGGGEVSLGGAVTYRPNLQFTLALQGKSIRLRYPAGLRAVLDGNLALNGTMQTSTLNGRVLLDTLSFTPDFDLASFGDQFSSNEAIPAQPGFADTMNLNISLQSKQNLSATSSQVSVEGSADLRVTGTAANPVITGRTELTAGEVFYRGNRYQLQRGVITFADPNQTTPNLNISAATKVEQYNLTIDLRGTLDRLTTTYVSDPPLATADIIHLVAFGNTSSEAAAASASQSTDSMVASSALGAGLSSSAQKLSGFSSVQIDPLLGGNNQNPSARIALQQRVTKNFLFTFSTDVSQPGQELVQGDYQINQRWSVNVTRDQLGGLTIAGRLHTKF